jgi:hypothetical protein
LDEWQWWWRCQKSQDFSEQPWSIVKVARMVKMARFSSRSHHICSCNSEIALATVVKIVKFLPFLVMKRREWYEKNCNIFRHFRHDGTRKFVGTSEGMAMTTFMIFHPKIGTCCNRRHNQIYRICISKSCFLALKIQMRRREQAHV